MMIRLCSPKGYWSPMQACHTYAVISGGGTRLAFLKADRPQSTNALLFLGYTDT